jgi:hypothetical protein
MILQLSSFASGQVFGISENKQLHLIDTQARLRSILNLTEQANGLIDDYYNHKYKLTKQKCLGEVTTKVNKLRWEAWSQVKRPCGQSTKIKREECEKTLLGSCWHSFQTHAFKVQAPRVLDDDAFSGLWPHGGDVQPEFTKQLCWRGRLVPTVFMLGGQKCGSTAVVNLITEHKLLPLVHALGVKEPKFFIHPKLSECFT